MNMADKKKVKIIPFDPKGTEDPELAELVEKVIDKLQAAHHPYYAVTASAISQVDGGAELMKKDAEWNRRGLLATASCLRHWQAEQQRIAEEVGENAAWNLQHLVVGGEALSRRLWQANNLFSVFARRKLPLAEGELLSLIQDAFGSHYEGLPAGPVIKLAGDVAKSGPLGEPVIKALHDLNKRINNTYDAKKLQGRISQLVARDGDSNGDDADAAVPPASTPTPTWAGRRNVLVDLKVKLKLMSKEEASEIETTELRPDQFKQRADTPLKTEHKLISEHLVSCPDSVRYWDTVLKDTHVGCQIIGSNPAERGAVFLAACERAASVVMSGSDDEVNYAVQVLLLRLNSQILSLGVELDRDGLFDSLLFLSAVGQFDIDAAQPLIDQLEPMLKKDDLTEGERYVLHRLRTRSISAPPMGSPSPGVSKLCQMLGDSDGLWLVPGESWADRAHSDLSKMSAKARTAWCKVLRAAVTADSAKPSKKWLKDAAAARKGIGPRKFIEQATPWLAAVSKGGSIITFNSYGGSHPDLINDGNSNILRGLVWMLSAVPTAPLARTLADLLVTAIKKVPGVGPRAVKVANACVWALGELAGNKDDTIRDAALAQLARLKARVTFKTTLKAIEKALDKAAEAAGMSRDELEELGVPAFGFEAGVLRNELGSAQVTLSVQGNRVVTQWINDKGKVVKSPPAAVKREYKDDVKELKQFAKDAEGILAAGRARLDTIFLAQKTWTLEDCRERYLDHGLLSTIVRRLIWLVDDTAVMFEGDNAHNADGEPVELGKTAEIQLWHPVGRAESEVLAWRQRLEDQQITQPFKQAHREVYLLTDAERNTQTYSNRFAAHILKQHQFNALCGARGWRNQLRLMVDDAYEPANKPLHAFGLRAEYWVEGAGDDYGTDTTEAGTYLYLATDQVRFYRTDAAPNYAHASGGSYEINAEGPGTDNVNEPLPLEDVPPLVLSEILRDVDLFVGVASVGNDPAWQDGGPEGRYRDYWHSYSFGDLSGTAKTRKTLLERLIPRLKVADRCHFDDKFLVVQGDKRTYKIHLGSGNILMEPNAQYLCIVPNSSMERTVEDKVFLPFEGDRTLSIILSKAFLLAEDAKITDRTILSQIAR